MKEIQLTQGKVALVDDEDFDWLNQWKWCCSHDYANKAVRLSNGKYSAITMHRLILLAHKGQEVDHINGNRLDNRRVNLRFCSRTENQYNKKRQKNNTTGYKGVRKHRDGKWEAKIRVNGERIYLGIYVNIHDAAKAYDEAALKYHGEFAYLNGCR